MADEKLVRYERDGMIGRIVLNRPEKRNSLNLRVWNSLGDAVSEAEKDSEARVILLKGEGKSFCALALIFPRKTRY